MSEKKQGNMTTGLWPPNQEAPDNEILSLKSDDLMRFKTQNAAYEAGVAEGRRQVLELLEKHKFGGVCGFIEQRVKELDSPPEESPK